MGPDSDVAFGLRTVAAGVWSTAALSLVGGAYVALTWSRPHRPLVLAVVIGCFAASLLMTRLPLARIVASRWREAFFLGWSVGVIAAATVTVAADGGASSPGTFIFVFPLVFAALSYPPASLVAVGALDLVACVATLSLVGDPEAGDIVFTAGSLAGIAGICTWQAANHARQRAELARASRTDALTGALNRRGFSERFDAALALAARSRRPLVLLVLDLDGFKRVNDSRGHGAGDELLAWVAETLAGTLRGSDAVGRLGGDEFAVLLADVDARGAEDALARAQAVLARRIAASGGFASVPGDGTDREALYHHADLRLYAEKRERQVTV